MFAVLLCQVNCGLATPTDNVSTTSNAPRYCLVIGIFEIKVCDGLVEGGRIARSILCVLPCVVVRSLSTYTIVFFSYADGQDDGLPSSRVILYKSDGARGYNNIGPNL